MAAAVRFLGWPAMEGRRPVRGAMLLVLFLLLLASAVYVAVEVANSPWSDE